MAKKSKKQQKQENQIFAWIASFFTIIGFLVAIILKKEDKYVMYYAKHGLVLFIGFVIAGFLMWIPIVGWVFWVFVFVLWIVTWINALSGKKKETFLVTELAEKIEL
ncbi:MAG: hypothetical protein ACOC1P_03035 [Minisyncoccales bacterium]